MLSDNKQTYSSDFATTKLFNAYQLCLVYFKMGDMSRILRFFEHNISPHSQEFTSFRANLDRLALRQKMKCRDTQEFILHLYAILANALMLDKQFKKASEVFYNICKLFNKWKTKSSTARRSPIHSHEFGVDEYIRTKASYAECLVHIGYY